MPVLRLPHAEFVCSCKQVAQAPRPPLPEIAFAGRSNVGKSSLINALVNQKQLAKVSRTPGKTRLLNYYRVGGNLCYFVDLPGYGYARVPGAQLAEWGHTIEEYLRDSPRLVLVVLLLDIRRKVTPLDEQMMDALQAFRRRWLAVATKTDKLSSAALPQALGELERTLLVRGAEAFLPFALPGYRGREAVWDVLRAALNTTRDQHT